MKTKPVSFAFLASLPIVAFLMATAFSAYSQVPSPVSNQILAVPQMKSYAQGAVTGFPSGSFTVEGYVYFPNSPPGQPFVLLQKEGFCYLKIWRNSQYLDYYEIYYGVATGLAGQFAGSFYRIYEDLLNNSWCHIAVTHDSSSNTNRLFLNGGLLSPTGPFTGTSTVSTNVVVGGIGNLTLALGFFVDELRVSSVVRYTTDFTLPTTPFTSDDTTAALWHFDDGQGATSFADSSPNGNTLLGYNGAVIDANFAPVANAISDTTNEDMAKTIILSGSDTETCELNFSIASNPSHGTLGGPTNSYTCVSGSPNRDTNSIVYTPSSNYNGPDSFRYRVNDGTKNSATVTVSIIVNSVNDAPVAFSQSLTNAENTALAITLNGSDVDGPVTNFTVLTQPASGSLIGTAPNLTYTPVTNWFGSNSFTFTVDDGSLTSAVATVTITITNMNDAPVAFSQSLTNAEDTVLAITLNGSTVDGLVTNFTVLTQPANGTLTGTVPNLTYTPATNWFGSDSFTFEVNDGSLTSSVATVTITITNVNDAPVALSQSLTNAEETALAITLTGSDVDGPMTNFTVLTQPASGSLTGTSPNLIYTPATNWFGSDSFTFTVDDGSLTSAVATVTITVSNVNDTPVAFSQSLTNAEDTALAVTLMGSDMDGPVTNFAVLTQPASGTLSGTVPNLSYLPATNFTGVVNFTFSVNDGSLTSGIATVMITITNVNGTPLGFACATNKTVECGQPWDFDLPTATGGCGSVTVSVLTTVTNGSCPQAITRTWSAVDSCANSNTCTQTITNLDTTLPGITLYGDNPLTNECHAAFTDPGATANDTCAGNLGVTTNDTVNPNSVGIYTIKYTATDPCGNSATNTRTVYVVDTTVPVITYCPENIVVTNAAGLCGSNVVYTISTSDNCGVASTNQMAGLASGSLFPVGVTTNVFVVADAARNTNICSFTVTVEDAEKPVINCPASISVTNMTGLCGSNVVYTITASDNCGVVSTNQLAGLASGSLFPVGATTNVFRVTDAAGNTNECSFVVTVLDTEKPVISCPADKIVQANSGNTATNVALGWPQATNDNCAILTVSNNAAVLYPEGYPLGTNLITWTVVDTSGNTATYPQQVIVQNTPLPVVANFDGNPTNGSAPLTVTFTNLSTGATNYTWDFGDGNISANEHPVNIYTNAGSYTVNLTAVGLGGTNSLPRTNYIIVTNSIVVNQPPVANTDFVTRTMGQMLTVNIADMLANDTDPETNSIIFTGTSATSTNGATITNDSTQVFYVPINFDPTNDVNDSFTYTISDGSLVATGTVIVVVAAPVYETVFTNGFANNGLIPDGGSVGWWDTRELSGMAGMVITNVDLTLTISGGFNGDLYAYLVHDSGFAVVLNRVGKTTEAGFGYADQGFDITVSDLATQSVDVHLYAAVSYATNEAGQVIGTWKPDGRNMNPGSVLDTDERTATLSSFNGLNPNGNWTLFLADLSAGPANAVVVQWGLQIGMVSPSNQPPVLEFTANPTNGATPLTVYFTNLSSGATNYLWDFGDGHSSTDENPTHVFTNAGTYSVTLTAVGAGGTNSLTRTNYVVVTNLPPQLVVTPANLGFGTVFTGATAQASFVVSNAGGSQLDVAATIDDGPFAFEPDTATKLLLHMDGAEGSTVFADSSLIPHTLTASGDARITTAQSRFGGASALFDGSSDYLTIPDNDDWDFGIGDFTVDFWVRFSGFGADNHLMGQYISGTTFWDIRYYNAYSRLYLESANNNIHDVALYCPWTPSPNTWYHLAFVRITTQDNQDAWRIFIDGQSQPLTLEYGAWSGTFRDFSSVLYIGDSGQSAYLNGQMDEVRISKGIARWTTNFIPAAEPYSACTAFSLAAFTATNMPVSFSPTNEGWFSNSVVFTSNAGDSTNTVTGWGATHVVADFVADPTNGVAPLTVYFTNLTSGATNYSWDFGDGNSSVDANPAHTYTNAGTYSVTLTAVGPGGTNSLTRTNYIVVTNPPASLVVYPPELSFGVVLTGATAQASFVVSNAGGSQLDVTATIGGGPFGFEGGSVDSATKLLLHMDGTDGSTVFLDSAAAPKTVTALDNAQIVTAKSKFGGASGWFDGLGDSLSFADSDDWDFGSGDFTIDFWVRFNALPPPTDYACFWHQKVGGSSRMKIHLFNNSGTCQWLWVTEDPAGGTLAYVAQNTTVLTNVWLHMAFVRSGNQWKIFQDGTQLGSDVIDSDGPYDSGGAVKIGDDNPGTVPSNEPFNGWLDELRVSKGLARWTANFTPPAIPYSPDAYTKLLLHMDGADGTTAFVDSSGSPKSVTANGDAQADTSQFQFGGASALFDGNGDYLTIPDSDDWTFETGDFTIDFWVQFSSLASSGPYYSYTHLIGQSTSTTDGWWLGMIGSPDGSGKWRINFNINGTDQCAYIWTISSWNVWHHVALVHESASDFKIYLDGTHVTGAVDKVMPDTASALDIGYTVSTPRPGIGGTAPNNNYLDGHIDEVLISKGVARWTSSFTPPSAPYGSSVPDLAFSVPPFGSTNIVVNFTPPTVGDFTNAALFASNGGNSTNTVTGTGAIVPLAQFTAGPTNGVAPLTVYFTNLTSGATNYTWDFGDGKSSTDDDPVNTYTTAGTYSVTLTAIGAGGTNSLTRTNCIVVTNSPPKIVITPASLDFGAVLTGATAQASFVVSNAGGSPLNVTATIEGRAFAFEGETPDPATKLLLHMDGEDASTTFTDSSGSGEPVSANGNAQIDTEQFTFGSASALFDGGGDYLTVPDSEDWNFGSGDFTIECWFRTPTLTSDGSSPWYYILASQRKASDPDYNYWYFGVNSNDGKGPPYRLVFSVQDQNVGTITLVPPVTVSSDTWYHFAVARSGNTWFMFQNGSLLGSEINASAIPNLDSPLMIGYLDQTPAPAHFYCKGYIDEFRITKGVARWTSNFIPPAAAYGSSTTNLQFTVPAFNSTNIALSFTPPDTAAYSNAVVFESNGGNSTNAITGLGAAQVLADFTGSPTNGFAPLTVWFTNLSSGATNYAWDFGDGNSSTVENPANTYTTADNYTITLTAVGPGGTNSLTRTNYIVVTNPPAGLVVSPPELSFGVVLTGATAQASFVVTNAGGSTLTGIATIQGGPFAFAGGTVDAATKLLLHMDGPDGSTTFLDSSSSGKTVTANGDAQIDTVQAKFGGASGLFDGDGDYLTIPDSEDWAFGTGNFTVDFWVNFNSPTPGGFVTLFQDIDNYSDFAYISGGIRFVAERGGVVIANYDSGWSPATNTWYHLALTRNESSLELFIDGVKTAWTHIGTPIASSSLSPISSNLRVGYDQDYGVYLNGWIEEVRISKGIARWTETFTPPNAPYGSSTTELTFSVPVLGSTNIAVNFTPPTVGDFTNMVVFTSNGSNSTNAVTGRGELPPAASFTASPTSGVAPLEVTFTDTSTGTITNRFWDFGDGATTNTTATAVEHTYANASTNTVTLIVSGPLAVSTNTVPNYIVVTNPPPPVITWHYNADSETLELNWNGQGFRVQCQTNSLDVGISTNWFDYPGGTTSPVIVTNDFGVPTAFYRLVWP